MRPEDPYDSLIEIRTPGTSGAIANEPKPAQDPDENFLGIFGLAFDGNNSFAFSGHTMLRVNQFNRDSSRELELTGRPYMVDAIASATGTILGDPVDPPVVVLNSLRSNPPHLSLGPQPSSWAGQRSQLSDIVIQLGGSITEIPEGSIVLSNLGVSGTEIPAEINLRADQINLAPSGDEITILLDEGQLPDGRYQLNLAPSVTSGPQFAFVGDRINRFFLVGGDWDGNARVELLDFASFS